MPSRAVLITGPPGAGKSSVLEQLATLLELGGVAFGALESEQLGWGSPWLTGEPVVQQLRAVMNLQRRAGRQTFVIAATTETSEELAEIVGALGAERVATVLLTASPDVVAARIDAREPDLWPGKARLIAHARRLAESMPTLTGIDVRVYTEHRDAGEVAAEVLGALQDLGMLP